MIVLFIHSGIGNQFFQYAFARNLAINTNEKIYISTYNMKKTSEREFVLNDMVAGRNVAIFGTTASLITKIIYYFKRKFIQIMTRGENLDFELSKFGIYNLQSPYDYVNYPRTNTKLKFVFSNYQNIMYWKENEDTILSELRPENEYDFKDIKIDDSSVCVHIRRGDYVKNERWRKELYVCDNQYYQDAMRDISKRIGNPRFFIFSNTNEDIEEIKKEMTFDFPVEYMKPEGKDYLDLFKMSKFHHFIISNSTFSWWAQELSEYDGYVVVPSIWNRLFSAEGFRDSSLYKKKLIVVEVK